MGFTEETVRFRLDDTNKQEINKTLTNVYRSLDEKGYNPINQILGYLISGDPGYISSYKEARDKITKFDRTKVLMCILEGYLEKWNI